MKIIRTNRTLSLGCGIVCQFDTVKRPNILYCKIFIIFSQVLFDILTSGLWNAKGNVFETKHYCVNKSEQTDTLPPRIDKTGKIL